MTPLFSHRLLVVIGKGGVGRTVLTAALASEAASRGLRVCAVSLSGESALSRCFGHRPRYEATRVRPNLDVRCLTAAEAVGDFGQRKLGIPSIGRWFLESNLMAGLLDAVPGLADVVQLGKIEDMLHHPRPHEPHYDLVVLDAPATGHGLALLESARVMRAITKMGPFAELARIIEDFLANRREVALILATLPSALPVQEAVELATTLAQSFTPPRLALVNRCQPPPPEAPWPEILAHLAQQATPPALTLNARLRHAMDRAQTETQHVAHLTNVLNRLGTPDVLSLPNIDGDSIVSPLVHALKLGIP